MQSIEEGSRELVVSGGDCAIDFEMSDHALDAVSLAVDAPVPADFGYAIGFGRNTGAYARSLKISSDGIAAVALVGEKISRFLIGQSHHVFEGRRVMGFAGREVEGERQPLGITETMN